MFYEKILLLSQTIIECLDEADEQKILKAFTDLGIEILDADFGFVWINSYATDRLELAYKSADLPYMPKIPHKRGRNYQVLRSSKPDFVSRVEKRSDEYDVSRYMESFVIIPISHRARVYGNIVLCFKKTEPFPKEKRIICTFIGNTVAQTIAIHRLMASEHERVLFEEEKKRTQFIADAAHELRTPLAIIKGNVDLALQGGVKSISEAERTLRAIDHEARHLSGLISDMALLTSSMDSSHKKFVFSNMHLGAFMKGVMDRCASLAKKKRVSMEVKVFPDILISGDEMYLDKLFVNIIKNAIVYGKKDGHIEVSATKSRQTVRVEVRDDGIGISPKDLPHIFERFYRSAAARAQNSEGTGLGLAIVKWITEAHGGTVSAASVEDKGSTFIVSLPIVR